MLGSCSVRLERSCVRTFSPKPEDIQRKWWVIDAEDLVLGRLSTEAARLLRGKHKTIFAPHVDTGDHVIVINAAKVFMTANKADKTFTYRHSGYPGGLTQTSQRQMLEEKPEELIRNAIRGMLPKGSLGRQMITKLKVYAGPTHSHHAQQPQPLELAHAKRAS
jgi:large subunit ribosomal protein L13